MLLAHYVDVFVEDLLMSRFVSFCFKGEDWENFQRCGDVFFNILIAIASMGASALGMFHYITKL